MLVKDDERALVRVVKIDQIKPIAKADRLEIAVIGGWECVVQKGKYSKGDTALYFEIDSAIFLDNPVLSTTDKQYLNIKLDNSTGKQFAVIKTVRLRGALSQGLLLPMSVLSNTKINKYKIGDNLTDLLNVKKYVSDEEARLYSSGSTELINKTLIHKIVNLLRKNIIISNLMPFPDGHKKSSEARIQNYAELYKQLADEKHSMEISVKLNGESITFYTDILTKEIGVAQRNYALRTTVVHYTKTESLRLFAADFLLQVHKFIKTGQFDFPVWKKSYDPRTNEAVRYFFDNAIDKRIISFNKRLAKFNFPYYLENLEDWSNNIINSTLSIQGEMVGPDFNNNAEKLNSNKFYMYRAYLNGNITVPPLYARQIAKDLGVDYVPVINDDAVLPETIDDMLTMAEGPNYLPSNINREGLVIKSNTTNISLKVISNKFLERQK